VVSRLMKYFLAVIGGATAIIFLFYFADQGVLAIAAKYADDERKLADFLSDMGYPKNGEWCGEFAASIIKRAGGTPPSSAAIASNWRGYGTPDAMPHVGDVAVADRGVPTGATGSHVGFVTDVDLNNGTFTLESGNSSDIYTTRKISCFSFHTPPNNVLSALIGNGVPSITPIGTALTGLPLSRDTRIYPILPAISSPSDRDDCPQGSLNADHYDEIQNDDSSQRGQRVCVVHLPPSDAQRFCPYTRSLQPSMCRRRSALANPGG
jgi:CHAP domain